jgi:hypothetical protein
VTVKGIIPWITLCLTLCGLTLCAACAATPSGPGNDPSASQSPSAGARLDYPGTDEGARKVLTEIRTARMPSGIQSLRPATADYKALFQDAFAAKAESYYNAEFWATTEPEELMADPGQTEIRISKATTEDISAWTPEARQQFPGGYEKIRGEFKPGLTVYSWKYIKPGEERGIAYDGLVHVNGHWTFLPKPYRVNES